jgi:1,4-alpha-glucan branching enzyme
LDWGTYVFDFGRSEVRNFLVANALYWLHEFHCDGLRVDAVASMLYLDYSREHGEWLPNRYGGRENLEAIDFLREMNAVVSEDAPGCVTVAEDSTAWPGVTRPINEGGLGFTFKWNMGWMHDTLSYFERDPIHRKYHQGELTFAMVYENSEHFIMPLSHDEMVHMKGSLYAKMPGDHWQKMANLRALFAYQFTRPGKSLLFMGSEDPSRAAMRDYLSRLAHVYRALPPLWQRDGDHRGFEWIDAGDVQHSVLSFVRWTDHAHVVVVLNLTPTPHANYRIGVPEAATYVRVLGTDDARWGGSGYPMDERVETDDVPYHGRRYSVQLSLPPLSALILAPERVVPASLLP